MFQNGGKNVSFFIATSKGVYEVSSSTTIRLTDAHSSSLVAYDNMFFRVQDDLCVVGMHNAKLLTKVQSKLVRILNNRFNDIFMCSLSESKSIENHHYIVMHIDNGDEKQQICFHHPFKTGDSLFCVLQQDGFLYFLFESLDEHLTKLAIYTPAYQLFGKKDILRKMVNPVILGYKLYFINRATNAIEFYDLVYERICVLFHNEECKPVRFCVDKSSTLYFITSNHDIYAIHDVFSYSGGGDIPQTEAHYLMTFDALDARDGDGCAPLIHQIMLSVFGMDHSHSCSDLTTSHVKTLFPDQMTPDESSLRNIIMNFSEVLYEDEELSSKAAALQSRFYPTIDGVSRGRVHNCIMIGDDVHDIFNIPTNMFDSHKHIQHITKSMFPFYQDDADAHSDNKVDRMIRAIRDEGVHIMPKHVFSGKFHLIYPEHAKGWHHNIESVPQTDVRVIYFVCTDKSHFGGSFFLYRHPISRLIHAVPDIHGTMKEFYLQSHPDKVLWHSIGSFTARRVSMGLSQKQHMQSFNELYKRLNVLD